MILCCSQGHLHNTESMQDKWWHGEKRIGDRCGMLMSYDRLAGSAYCNRKLFDLDKRVSELYEKIFTNRLSDERFINYCWVGLPTGKQNGIAEIRRKLIECKDVNVGYTATKIRGYHNYIILYRKK